MARAKKKEKEEIVEKFFERDTTRVLDENMGRYAEKVLLGRAIPEVRDGLKPVHRRIMHTMNVNKIHSTGSHRKVANITGNVMGNYHPHGDSSISDAISLMSQDWRNNIVLVDIEGNNGSIDGDRAAAPRYIEARMTKEAELLFDGIEQKIVPFVETYDNRTTEPTVLPARWPVLFANGASGIGIGFSTNIPPNNVLELLKAAVYYNKHENATLKQLMKFVPAPDFPTGGILVNNEEVQRLYETGEGKLIVRGKVHQESNSLVITEVPYEVTKSGLALSIAEAVTKARIDDQFVSIEDESEGDAVRLVVNLKRGADIDAIEQFLYNKTQLQVNFSATTICISDNKPTMMNLVKYIGIFVEFRRECITKKSEATLATSLKRKHIVEGFLKMAEFPDEIIAEIKRSNGKADSSERIQKKFGFTKEQGDAIVTMQLYRISRQDIQELEKENEKLEDTINFHTNIINDKNVLIDEVEKELKETQTIMKDHKRRTTILDEGDVEEVEVNENSLKKSQPAIVTVSPYSAQRMTQQMYDNAKDNSAASIISIHDSKTSDALLMFTRNGLTMQRVVDDLEHSSIKSEVDSFVKSVKTFFATDEILTSYTFPVKLALEEDESLEKKFILSVTKNGQVKKTSLADVLLSFKQKGYMSRTKPYNGLKLAGDQIIFVAVVDESDIPKVNLSLKRNSGGRVTKVEFDKVNTQGASGSGISAMKMTKPEDFATITTTNVGNLTKNFYVEQ